ncbi:zinc finger domain-containing protein [Corynebacterium glaucum]|uniref:zinc finger domain-containing protein n=1 Tax=Corynebacterium glaucum TaxID=187491 RepID=UPI003F53916F
MTWRWDVDPRSSKDIQCPYCGAPIGESCVSSSGSLATSTHVDRMRLSKTDFEPVCRYCKRPQSEHSGENNEVCP